MPTNANVFNSRVTSEALEAKFRQVFPAQGGAELVQDLFASGVIQPVVDFSSVAEGSVLPTFLQTAVDFSTGFDDVPENTASSTIISGTGFWKVDFVSSGFASQVAPLGQARIFIDSGITTKTIWNSEPVTSSFEGVDRLWVELIVFLRAGDSLKASTGNSHNLQITYRQVADVNGNLVNPFGFTFQ